jgi:hypothetical protein
MHEALPALLTLCRREFDLTARSAAYRWPCLVFMLLAGAIGAGASGSAATAVWSAWRLLGPWFGFAALYWATAAASRDRWGKTEPLLLTKPAALEGFVAARFLGTFLATALGLALVLAGAMAGQAIAAGRLPSLLALALRVPAALPGLFYLSALGFTLSLLLRSPLAAAVGGLYWILVLLAGDHVARIYNLSLTQNGVIYGWAGAGLVLLGMLLYRRGDRGRNRWTRLLAGATVGGFLAAVGSAVWIVSRSHDPPLRQDELSLAISGQTLRVEERAPGFWLPDQTGREFGLHRVDGQILVIAFWSPEAPESVPVLQELAKVEQQFGAQGVVPVAVCLTEDHGASPFFARVDGYRFPMVTDVGTRWSNSLNDTSPVAAAYEVDLLPALVLTDRQRRVRGIYLEAASADPRVLWPALQALLRKEPG